MCFLVILFIIYSEVVYASAKPSVIRSARMINLLRKSTVYIKPGMKSKSDIAPPTNINLIHPKVLKKLPRFYRSKNFTRYQKEPLKQEYSIKQKLFLIFMKIKNKNPNIINPTLWVYSLPLSHFSFKLSWKIYLNQQ